MPSYVNFLTATEFMKIFFSYQQIFFKRNNIFYKLYLKLK